MLRNQVPLAVPLDAPQPESPLFHVGVRHVATQPLKIAYGEPDFSVIRSGQYWWRDNSAFIEPIVAGPRHQILLRPPRFGKSLFGSMLHKYLDINEEDNFDSLFAGTDISKIKDNEHRNKYHVMKFDFTVDISNEASLPSRGHSTTTLLAL